jgi:hypothetical protein
MLGMIRRMTNPRAILVLDPPENATEYALFLRHMKVVE